MPPVVALVLLISFLRGNHAESYPRGGFRLHAVGDFRRINLIQGAIRPGSVGHRFHPDASPIECFGSLRQRRQRHVLDLLDG
jgi:hypothetical protein